MRRRVERRLAGLPPEPDPPAAAGTPRRTPAARISSNYQVHDDWLRGGWSQQQLAEIHGLSRKQVRTILEKSPKYAIERLDHAIQQRFRRKRVNEIEAEYVRRFGYSKRDARKLARAESLDGKKRKYHPELEEKHEKRGFVSTRGAKEKEREDDLFLKRMSKQGVARLGM